MDDPIRSVKDKAKALEERTAKVDAIQAQVSRLERAMQDEEAPRRGGCLGWLFRRRARQPSAALDQAVFGHKASTASTTASDRLSTAAKSMEAHAESLGERAAAARAKAKSLMAAGKKFEALAMLKKAKQAEAQHSNAVATHAALERQIDVLAESALQKEVATALSASVAVAKKKTAGLLSKTEDAVDSAIELKDFAEDVSSAFGGLAGGQLRRGRAARRAECTRDGGGSRGGHRHARTRSGGGRASRRRRERLPRGAQGHQEARAQVFVGRRRRGGGARGVVVKSSLVF